MVKAIAWGAVVWMLGAVAWLGVARADIGAPITAWGGEVGRSDLVRTTLAPRRDQALQAMIHGYLNRNGYPVPRVSVWIASDVDMGRYMPAGVKGYAGTDGIVVRRSEQVTSWPPTADQLIIRVHEHLHYLNEVPGYGLLSDRDQDVAERVVQAVTDDLWERMALKWWPNSLAARLSFMDYYGVTWVRAASARAVRGPWWGYRARVWRRALVLADAAGRNRMLAEVGL